jgi:hypothetical protein
MSTRGRHPHKAPTARTVSTTTEPGRHADGDGLYLLVAPGGSKTWMLRTVVGAGTVSGHTRNAGGAKEFARIRTTGKYCSRFTAGEQHAQPALARESSESERNKLLEPNAQRMDIDTSQASSESNQALAALAKVNGANKRYRKTAVALRDQRKSSTQQ